MHRVSEDFLSECPYTDCPLNDDSEPTTGTRVFPYEMDWTTNNTVDACLNQCAAFGYPAAGLEYGDQCCAFSFLRSFARAERSRH